MKRVSALRLKTILCTVMALLVTMGLVSTQAAQAWTTPPAPTIEGPITGPGDMWSGLVATPSTTTPLQDYGYTAEEYFISGTAGGDKPYKTRILVRRPIDEHKFSGIVVAEIMHMNSTSVTFGPARASIMLRGHIHLEIVAQKTNVNPTTGTAAMKQFNPDRYGSLSIVSDAQLSDIVAQVGRLIRSNVPPSPLYPLYVRHLVLQGTSNASQALRTYEANAHFQYRLPDGTVNGSPIFEGYFATSTLGNAPMMSVDVPTIQMPTQTEVTTGAKTSTGLNYRRDDGDEPGNQFRLYEVAGMSHANARDTVSYIPDPCKYPVGAFPWGAMAAMGLNHLVEWVDHGTIPPRVARITTNGVGPLPLDADGNALGGVRNTYVDVPVATYAVPNAAGANPSSSFVCSLANNYTEFSEDEAQALYRNRGQYISQINQRLMELIRDGWFLPEYADLVRGDAQEVSKTLIKPQH